jgi:cytochrome c553
MSRNLLLPPPLVLLVALAATTGVMAAETPAGPAAVATAANPAQIEFFEKKIRPVLVERCYECHSAEAAKAGNLEGKLALDSRAGIRQGGESGPAVVPGDVNASSLIKALKHEGLEMPPGEKLSADVVADFVTWVQRGAADPRDGEAVASAAIDIEQGRQFWSFVPPVAHPRPAVQDAAWPARELDWFIRAAHEAKGVTPVAAATREEWLRRVSLDLTGLPPTPEELDAFLTDRSAEAFATVVERLLASPHFGERWARHWLDVARYTNDLGGTVGPEKAPAAFRYRDWVVNAFNADMPYDQFLRLQLAGDLLAEPQDDHVTRLAGLGFQGLGQKFSGNAVGMVKKKVADELDDRVDTVTRGLLGLTVSCARCHDHKFDPIPTRDYYALAAAYNGGEWNAELPLASPEQTQVRNDWLKGKAEIAGRITKLLDDESARAGRVELAKLAAYLEAVWRAEIRAARKLPPDLPALAKQHGLERGILERLVNALGKKQFASAGDSLKAWQEGVMAAVLAGEADADVPPAITAASQQAAAVVAEALADLDRLDREKQEKPKPEPLKPEHDLALKFLLANPKNAVFRLKPDEVRKFFTAEARQRHESLTREQAEHAKVEPPDPPRVLGVKGGGSPMQINIRGNADQLGVTAPPGFLQVLSRPAASGTLAAAFTRLDLATAIASRDNPLTARVFVNRVWHHLFGRGLVGTLANFGQLGDRPSHSELLDTLAVRFMEHGWSTKWLIREITLSTTYRLSSRPDAANQKLDGDNHLLWRMTPRRLEFEAWRDATLAVAGKLDRTLGGPPLFADGKQIHPQDPAHGRRTLYSFISRFEPNPTLTLFDVPEPNVTSERRTVTTIPQQQLFAINSPFMVAMSQAFAERLATEAPDEATRIDRAWRLAYARSPSPDERQAAVDYLQANGNDWPQLCHAILLANEFRFLP